MEYRYLGRSGIRVSAVSVGTNAFGARVDRPTSVALVHRALDAGINLIDTADNYGDGASEEAIGEALRGRRHQAVVATKGGKPAGSGPNDRGSSRLHLMAALEGSLRRLGTDYVDLYQVHEFDPATPQEDVMRTLDDMVRAGKVRAVGASNYAAWQLCKALWGSDRRGLVRFEADQPPYSLADRRIEAEVVPFLLDQEIAMLPYMPLAGGALTGKYRAGEPPAPGTRAAANPRMGARILDPQLLALASQVTDMARQVGCTPGQLSVAWLLGRPAVTSVIVGASRPQQVDENVGALDVRIPDEVAARLDELSRPTVHRPLFSLGG